MHHHFHPDILLVLIRSGTSASPELHEDFLSLQCCKVCLFVPENHLFIVQKEWREKREDFKKKVRRCVRKSQEMF